MLINEAIGKIWSFLGSVVYAIGNWIINLDMSRSQWTIVFIVAFMFGVLVCFQGYGSRKNY
jgi:hypothetical protein